VTDISIITGNSFFTSAKSMSYYHKLVIIRHSMPVPNVEPDYSEMYINLFMGLAYECLNEDLVYNLVCPRAQK